MSRVLFVLYRAASYVTGIILLALVFYAMPVKYFFGHDPEPTTIIGQTHGFLFAVYVVIVLVLAYARRWSLKRTALVVLAGTIPFAAFVAERKIVRAEREGELSSVDDSSG